MALFIRNIRWPHCKRTCRRGTHNSFVLRVHFSELFSFKPIEAGFSFQIGSSGIREICISRLNFIANIIRKSPLSSWRYLLSKYTSQLFDIILRNKMWCALNEAGKSSLLPLGQDAQHFLMHFFQLVRNTFALCIWKTCQLLLYGSFVCSNWRTKHSAKVLTRFLILFILSGIV